MVWAVLGLAVLIRMLGIDYGLPFSYWSDEYHEVMRAMELGAGNFNLSRTGKGGFYFLLFFEYGLYFVVMKITGVVTSAKDFAELFVRDPTMFYLLGRTTAAIFGAATVFAAYCLARRAYGANAALASAIFLAVNVLHVDLSHRVGVDVPMTCFATIALLFAVRISEGGVRKDYVLAALSAGLAATTKITGVLVLVPLLIAHGYASAARPGPVARRFLGAPELWLSAFMFAVVLIATNPGIVFDASYLSLFSTPSDVALDDEMFAESADGAPWSRPNLYLYYVDVLQHSMGWPLFSLAVISVAYATWRHRAADVLLLSFGLMNYLVIVNTSSDVLYYPRYALPIVVVVTVLAARLVADVVLAVPGNQKVILAAGVIVLAAIPTYLAGRATYVLTQTDTRTQAREWFDSEVPTGSKVLIEGSKTGASRLSVPLQDTTGSLDRRIAYWQVKEPRQARYLQVKRAAYEGGGYELELIKLRSVESLDAYAGRGIEFFVVRPEFFLGSRKSEVSSAVLLHRLRTDPRVAIVKRFPAEPGFRPGPSIEIYRLNPAAFATEPVHER